jgi:hypothetical protein
MTTGRSISLETTLQAREPCPAAANTITLTATTTSRKDVPHLVWIRRETGHGSLSSGASDSQALIVLCSAP